MRPGPVNIHGTAVVIGTTGLLFVGPSGSGKTMAAMTCLSAARSRGLFAALVADDQVFVSVQGGRLVATRPESIAGLMELRGTGIASLPSIRRARLDRAVLPASLSEMERLPDENEQFEVMDGVLLPLIRLPREVPLPLEWLARFVPFLGLGD
jgi:serine kinase of HPr protein (carbohydrate metabolism regulator)